MYTVLVVLLQLGSYATVARSLSSDRKEFLARIFIIPWPTRFKCSKIYFRLELDSRQQQQRLTRLKYDANPLFVRAENRLGLVASAATHGGSRLKYLLHIAVDETYLQQDYDV